jgi:hypothetical protein
MAAASWFTAIARMITAVGNDARPAAADRRAAFDAWEAYYHNSIYEPLSGGGQREQVNATLGNAAAADLAGLYNPVAEVVDLYQHVFGGAFLPSDDTETEDEPTDIRASARNPLVLPALDRIWQWSNLDVSKQQMCRLAPLHGTCGLRIVAVNDPDPLRRRVYLKPEHPRLISDVEQDARGNVSAIMLEYEVTEGLGDAQEIVRVREELDKQEFRIYRDDRLTSAEPNALGVVPYVLLRHQDTGDAFGLNAFYRARSPIDRLNALMTHVNTQIHEHVKVDWLIATSGDPPVRFELTGRNVIYVKLAAGAPTPLVEPMVASLNLADAISQATLLIGQIENRLPELKATSGVYLSGQSGETIAQLRAPAEHRLGLARATYEDALIRAQQICLSWGILMGLWDLGTGTGTREAADTAYRQGLEDHHLNRRALLPPVTSPTTTRNVPAVPAAPPSDGTDPMRGGQAVEAGAASGEERAA